MEKDIYLSDMIETETEYFNQITELFNNKDDYTSSDFDGVLTAIIKRIARDEDLLTFDERLERAKDDDMF